MEKQISVLLLCLILAACGDDHVDEFQMIKDPVAEKPEAEHQHQAAQHAASTDEHVGHDHVDHAEAPKADGAALRSPADISWTAPAGWKEQAAGGMRLASFQVPHESGAGDVSVISLAGDGGGMLANINRWRNQVGLDPIDESALQSTTKQIPSAVGTFTAVTLINPQSADKAICGGVLSGPSFTLFVKLTAHKACVEAQAETVYQFCAQAVKTP